MTSKCSINPLACVILAALVGPAMGPAMAQDEDALAAMSPDKLVGQIRAAVAERRFDDIGIFQAALWKRGNESIPAIERGIAEGDDIARMYLLYTLLRIPGDESTSLMVRVIGRKYSDSASGRALYVLRDRSVKRPLSSEELRELVRLVGDEHLGHASLAARVLGRCEKVPGDVRAAAIVPRFKQEILAPYDRLPSSWTLSPGPGAHLSPRVYYRDQFLAGIRYVGAPAIPLLREERRKAAGNAELDKWLLIALGMAGDRSVAKEVKGLVLHEPDRYVRCEAVSAYAACAGQEAIPLLTSLLRDETESEYARDVKAGRGVRLIAMVAGEELAKLKKPVEGQK